MARTEDKFEQKQQQLLERTATALRISPEEASSLLSIRRIQSIRVNTLKTDVSSVTDKLMQAGVTTKVSSLMSEGLYVTEGRSNLRSSLLTDDGDMYIQNAASWLPVVALNPQPGETILDMCAAPGGKTSHIAQRAKNQAFITANDNSRPRLHKLQHNLQRLGVENITYTLHDATWLARRLDLNSFDKILLDAPCSGEGMMTIDSRRDFESWSVAHIKRLQQLQKKLLVQAWQLLKPGGRLVYSTCTMAPEENEAVIDYLLRHNDDVIVEDLSGLSSHLHNKTSPVLKWNTKEYDARLSKALRLVPSEQVEAFFVISLTKENK